MSRTTLIIVITVANLLALKSYAYDDAIVHPEINENASTQSILFKVPSPFIEELGFKTTSEKKKVKEWLRQGGTDEDGTLPSVLLDWPQMRYLRHFHDPLKAWDSAGAEIWPYQFSSTLVWAQSQSSILSGDYSWSAAREHYYQALIPQYESEFALTFLTLGHLMHLVADMAVPAHVRNDVHPLGDLYEKWATIHCDPDKPADFSCNFNYPDEPAKRLTPSLSIFTHANFHPENRPCAA